MTDHGQYEILGETLDDAAGEAFDKGARMLQLSYPGGPSIQNCAQKGSEASNFQPGNPSAYKFPISMSKNTQAATYDFSFSGLKTSLRTKILELKKNNDFEKNIPDLAASYQYTICMTLIGKLKNAYNNFHPKSIHIAGGVSANMKLRELLDEEKFDCEIRFPKLQYCTDNAAMIASAGYFNFIKNPSKFKKTGINPNPSLKL